jgi:hypothetical protein
MIGLYFSHRMSPNRLIAESSMMSFKVGAQA